ncbi:N-acyl-phosphatidylethanolamine-hydrolyzing phospholipase D [Beauveria bassiana]|uniref:N-acyl-phosphatidylethanolamine-hydrolyzing phospholipase D n=1 Tax=Beauveria bassiana TaxID=176275 RepID=A0A2N6NXQ7_BEABA|nr:N-acyl-phosphatidylethanolamine-hydrolyzing phospholipase D [Beauveria bassiana]
MGDDESWTTSVSKIFEVKAIPEEAIANPHHVTTKSGKLTGFKNPYPSWYNLNEPSRMFHELIWPMITGKLSTPDTTPPTVNVVKPRFLAHRFASPKLRATWLGHACYYVEFPSGLRVLFDPVFEDRCSPFSFLGPRRYTPKPCDLGDLPVVDAVVISHSHYDHLSHASVLEIQKHQPEAQFFVGLGLESWFRRSGLRKVTELDWWHDAELTVNKVGSGSGSGSSSGVDRGDGGNNNHDAGTNTITARISCLPCQHTSARTLLDKDTTLWCSWAVSSGGRSVWFGGDTGYRGIPRGLPAGTDDYGPEHAALPRCPQFRQIGDLRGPFDLGLIPIGAYFPRAAFSAMHANPFDSVEIFKDTRCKQAMGIHWGTWALTMEDVLEPPRLLRRALGRSGIAEEGVFDVCDIGESREF